MNLTIIIVVLLIILIPVFISMFDMYTKKSKETFKTLKALYKEQESNTGLLHSRSPFSKDITSPNCIDNKLVKKYDDLQKLKSLPSNNLQLGCPTFKFDGIHEV